MANNEVFICYSHKDNEWLERVHVHLRPIVRDGIIDLFDDTKIPYGGDWKQIIREKISSAKIAIFLVSADFMASDFIHFEELPTLLAAAERNGAIALSVILSYCGFDESPLFIYRAVNQPSRPLLGLGKAEQDEIFYNLSVFVRSTLQTISPPKLLLKPVQTLSQINEIKIAEDYFFHGKFERAVQQATAILEKDPNNVDALLIRARASSFFYKKDDDYIRDAAQALVCINKNHKVGVGLMQYSQALSLLGWNKLALEHINKVIAEEFTNTSTPETNELLYQAVSLRMRIAYSLNECADAIADADWLLSIKENDGQVWFRKGRAHLGLKDYKEVIKCENIAIKNIPDFWLIYDVRGNAYSMLNKVDDAFDDFSKVFEKAPWYNATRRLKAAILTDLKRYPEALSEITIALMYEPYDINVLSMKAETCLNLGDYKNAKKAAETLLQQNSKDEFALGILSTIEAANKKTENSNSQEKVISQPKPPPKKRSIFDFIKKL